MGMKNHLLKASALAAGLLAAMPAVAAEEPAADGQSQAGIDDIVVTAQKRSESIQQVPIAVSALSEAQLESPLVGGIRDVAGRVPGLVIDPVSSGPKAAAIAIRGISFDDIEKSFDPAVGVVVDGVFIGTNAGQLLDSFDLAGMEVLRGPQGTLFGRNTIGGVVNVTRTRPTGEFGAKASFAYSNYDTKTGKLVVNTPMIGDVLALKGFFYYDQTDGYYFNATQNRRQGRSKSIAAGVTALFQPAEGFEALVTYEHQKETGETISTQLSSSGEVLCNPFISAFLGSPLAPAAQCDRHLLPAKAQYTIFQNVPTPLSNKTDAVTANVDIDIGPMTLTSVTGWRRNVEDFVQDFDASSVDLFTTHRPQTFRQFSQELRLAGDVAPWLNALVGLYYFDSHYRLSQTSNFGSGIAGPGFPPIQLQQDTAGDAKSYAAFADFQVKPTDRLTIGLGARYTRDRKAIFNNYGVVPALVQLSQPGWNGECVVVTGLLAPGVPAYGPGNNCEFARSFEKFTYRATANYEIADDKRLYASVSRGFRSGGFNGRAGSPTSVGPYRPEIVDAYEIGLKADWLDRRLRTNLALYQNDYDDKQEEVVQPSPPGSANPQETVIQNAASARIRGVEAEVIAQPAEGLEFNASLSHIDAEYRSFFKDVNGDNVPDDVSTLTLRRAPKWTWSLGVDYRRDVGGGELALSALYRRTGRMTTCIVPATPVVLGAVTNDPRCLSDPRSNLDASLSYKTALGDAELVLTLFGRNLTDDRGIAGVLPVAGLFTFGIARPPRTYGIQAQVSF